MVSILSRFFGGFYLWSHHRKILDEVRKLEADRKEKDRRILNLEKATMNGDEKWFLEMVKENPTCAFRVIEECRKKDD